MVLNDLTTTSPLGCRGGKMALGNGDCIYAEDQRPDSMSVLSEGS